MKYKLVNKVIIFVPKKRWRSDTDINRTLKTNFGIMEIKSDEKKFDEINSDPNLNFVYCWADIEDCAKIKKKFIIVDNQFHGYIKKSGIKKEIHDLVLTESENFKKYIPKNIPTQVYKLISYDHENSVINEVSESKKEYDWIMISSFDKRKRHIDFLNSLKQHGLSKLKGCIIARDPNNKTKKITDMFKLTPWKILNKVKRLQKSFNFDIFLNVHQEKKIELSLKSKVYVNCSILDSGPRAQVEVMQMNIPVLSMPHIGSSDLIEIGKNGEISENIKDIPTKLKIILDNYDKYSLNTFKKYLSSDVIMPKLVQNIMQLYNKKLHE